MLSDVAGGKAEALQPVLVERETQRRHTLAPVAIDRPHLDRGLHHGPDLGCDAAQLVGIGPHDAEGHRERRRRAEHQLGHAHPRLGRQAVGHRLAQPELECLARRLVIGQDDNLGERGIGQFRRHGQVEARRSLADVGAQGLRFRLLGQPGLDLGGRRAGLLDSGAIRHLDFDQDLGPVGRREELLVDHGHAQDRDDEGSDHARRDQPFAPDHRAQQTAEALVVRGGVDAPMSALVRLEVGQQFHPQVGRKHDGDDPRDDQGHADDPEQVAGILASGRLGEAVRHEADRRHQGPGEHGRGGMAPRIGRGADAVIAFLHLHHHHLDGDDRVVDQESEGQDQRAQRDPVKVLAGRRHDHEDRCQGQGNRCRDHDAGPPAHAQEADQHDHAEGDAELDHELADGRVDIDRLVRDF